MAGIPCFEYTGGKGSSENGKALTAHWISQEGVGMIPVREDFWLICKFFVFDDCPNFPGWMPHWNMHFPSDVDGFQAVNPSSIQLDLNNGRVRVYTKGGGKKNEQTHQWQDVIQGTYPPEASAPGLPRGRWVDFVGHFYGDETHGTIELWMDGEKIVDEVGSVANTYTGVDHYDPYNGFYCSGNSLDFHLKFTLFRFGHSFEEARAAVPVPGTQWGALTKDTIVSTRIGDVDSEDFNWPAELVDGTPVPPEPSTFKTSLTQGAILATPYAWQFTAGVQTVRGSFFIDGVRTDVQGNGPYEHVIETNDVADGEHVLGHAWDLPDGTHHSPGGPGYTVTVANTVVPVPPIPPEGDPIVSAIEALAQLRLAERRLVKSEDALLDTIEGLRDESSIYAVMP